MKIYNAQCKAEGRPKGREKFLCLNFSCLAIKYEFHFIIPRSHPMLCHSYYSISPTNSSGPRVSPGCSKNICAVAFADQEGLARLPIWPNRSAGTLRWRPCLVSGVLPGTRLDWPPVSLGFSLRDPGTVASLFKAHLSPPHFRKR